MTSTLTIVHNRSLLIVLYSSFYHMVLKALCDRFGLKRLQCFLSNGVGSTVCLYDRFGLKRLQFFLSNAVGSTVCLIELKETKPN